MVQPTPIDSMNVDPNEDMVLDRKHRSPLQLATRRFLKNKLAIVGLVVFFIIICMAIFAPLLTDHDPKQHDLLSIEQSPTSEHILGTDSSGRDNFSRLLYGSRISLIVGFSAMVFTLSYWPYYRGCSRLLRRSR